MLLRIPAFRWIVISGAVVNFILYSFSTFIAPFLTRVHGLSVARAGVWAGWGRASRGSWAPSPPGRWATGPWAAAVCCWPRGAALAAALPAYAALEVPAGNATGAVVLAMTAYGLLQMYYGLVYAAIQDFVEPRLRATAMAVYFVAMYLCGASFGPLLTGRVSDHFARAAAGDGAGDGGGQSVRAAPGNVQHSAAVCVAGGGAVDGRARGESYSARSASTGSIALIRKAGR